ncbi:MAG: hypothetical protein V3U87_14170, partial [Methylococcaceae bacterium]
LINLAIPNAFGVDVVKESVPILNDPFKKPTFTRPSVKKSKTVIKKNRQPSWEPRLLMTLRAEKKSMANIDGQLIQLGEKVNGYKLIKVDEREVVLVNHGKMTRLTLDKDEK